MIIFFRFLILLLAAHAVCDYPLQGDFLAKGKKPSFEHRRRLGKGYDRALPDSRWRGSPDHQQRLFRDARVRDSLGHRLCQM